MTEFADNIGGSGTNVAALADTFARFHATEIHDATTEGAAPYAIVPEGKSVESLKAILDQYLTKPRRRRGISNVRDLGSFTAVIARFKSDESVVYADPSRTMPKLVAVFDYLPAGDDATKADWMEHRSVYAPELSEEWKRWHGQNNKWMNQSEFSAFVVNNITSLVVPNLDDPALKAFTDLVEGVWATPSQVHQLSRKLEVNAAIKVRNAETISSGEVSIVYEEVHNDGAGAPLKVPTLFQVCIPVFYAGALYRIAARLRYRLAEGRVLWMYELVRLDLVFDDAFKGIVDAVRSEADVPVFLGSPEA